MNNAPSCGTCRYFAPLEGETQQSGDCRVSAPAHTGTWPPVDSAKWCGEYAPKGEAAIDPMREVADYLKDRIALCGHGSISITCGPCMAPWLPR